MLMITNPVPSKNNAFGMKSKRYIDATKLIMIAADVAKFFAILPEYLIHTATDKPPTQYQKTTIQTSISKPYSTPSLKIISWS